MYTCVEDSASMGSFYTQPREMDVLYLSNHWERLGMYVYMYTDLNINLGLKDIVLYKAD